LRRSLLLAGLPAVVAALAIGCSSQRPIATIAKAEFAVDHAQANKAPEYALAELRSAQAKLVAAREAMDDGNNDEARRLAEESLAEAQLAEAKAQSTSAQSEVRQQTEILREEASRIGEPRPRPKPRSSAVVRSPTS
jgi:hypothetical protein